MRKYNLYNTVNANIRKALKEKIQNNELNNERMLSYVYATFEGHDTFNKDIKDIQHSGVKNSWLLIGNICFITYLTNIWDKNIVSNPKKGTILRNYQKNKYLKNINLRKNPETGHYFLKRGTGELLLHGLLDDLKEEKYNTVVLQASSDNLIKYYKKFGFQLFPEKVKENMIYMYLHF